MNISHDVFLFYEYVTFAVARDRMGRMLTFMARIWKEKSIPAGTLVRGVGVDEKTAILLDAVQGNSTVVGFGTAYVCAAAHKAEVCEPGVPLTFTDIDCMRLDPAHVDTYDFVAYNGTGVRYVNNVIEGTLTQPYGP
jgi:cyanophycinase-like exopeptidase